MTPSYAGLGTSPGAAAAPVWRPRRAADSGVPSHTAATASQVRDAFAATTTWLEELAARHRASGAASHADILDAESLIASDPTFAGEVVDHLSGSGAVAALRQVTERLAGAIAALDSPELQERAVDIREVGRLVEDRLLGRPPAAPPEGPFVLFDREVAAPDLLANAEQVAGAVSLSGGPSSHASIIARSLGIPFVVEVPSAVLDVPDGVEVLVDGDAGEVVVRPDASRLQAVRTVDVPAAELAAARTLPARTLDGVDVTLPANVSSAVEARRALQAGASGVGLLRTELAHLGAPRWPNQVEHERSLRPVLAELAGRPVTVRLLDFTNDKKPPFLSSYAGQPSLALFLADSDALDAQLSAVLSVGRSVDLRILVPMVERAEDLAAIRARLVAISAGQGTDVPPLGAMLETPAAIDALPSLVEVADFFSLGTNDLTAATLGMTRDDRRAGPSAAAREDVLRQVDRAARLTAAAGRPLSVCGDAAADPDVLPLLLGVGLTTLSVAPTRVDDVRVSVRSTDVRAARARVVDVLSGAPAGLVRAGVSDA